MTITFSQQVRHGIFFCKKFNLKLHNNLILHWLLKNVFFITLDIEAFAKAIEGDKKEKKEDIEEKKE